MADCKSLKPSTCGNRGLDIPKDGCDSIRFEGVDDVELNQGVCIDLNEGVHAYDGDGTEIPFTASPSEIGCCDVGEHEVTYTARGKGNKMLPSFCADKPKVYAIDCGLMTKTVKRLVTILQALPPKILGIGRTIIAPEASFDAMSGVSGVDDNGKATEVTFDGTYYEKASGEIATFDSISGNAKSLKVQLEPIQDLHGYDKPWSGGNGRNLFNMGSKVSATHAGLTLTSDDDYLIANGTKYGANYFTPSTLEFTLPSGTYYAKAFTSETASSQATIYVMSGSDALTGDIRPSEQTFTLSEETALTIRFGFWTDNATYSDYKIGIVISKTSGIDAYSPYSNICPISGHTECVTVMCGGNLWDSSSQPSVRGDYNGWHIGSFSNGISVKLFDKGNGASVLGVYFGITNNGKDASDGVTWALANGNVLDGEINRNAEYVSIYPKTTEALSKLLTRYNVVVTIWNGTYPTTYEPYIAPKTYTATLGRTVYGGTVDMVTGELVIDRANIASYNGEALPSTWISDRDEYASGTTPTTGAQVVYELATPQTIQLTPQTIALLTGTNNVWGSGEVEVGYPVKMPNGSFTFPYKGTYEITYDTEDDCGNHTTETRYVFVGDDLTLDETYAVVCVGKVDYAVIPCDGEYDTETD